MKTTILKNIRKSSLFYNCFIIAILLSITSCKKRKDIQPELPPITQEGKNTFGCMFGDEFWLPANSIFSSFEVHYTQDLQLKILCYRKSNITLHKTDSFELIIKNIEKSGIYELTTENSEAIIRIIQANNFPAKTYILNNSSTLKLSRFDTLNKIVSGEFSFQVKEENTGKIVEITSGRFDAIYTY